MKKRRFKWQDVVFMVGGLIFVPSLIFSIVEKADIPITTSLPTAIVLAVFVVCYATLNLWLAAFATALTAICWVILIF